MFRATIAALLMLAPATVRAQESEPAATVEMTEENTFEPKRVVIEVGEVVEWTNPSSVMHTATADPEKANDPGNVELPEGAEPWDSGSVDPGETYRRTFNTPGTHRYVCLPHERIGMIGSVEVKAKSDDSGGDEQAGKGSGEPSDSGSSSSTQSSGSDSGSSGSQPSTGFAANLASWLGKLHPPSINFPIGLILSAVVAELLWSATGRRMFDHAARFCVWVGAIGVVVSVTLGWLFAGLAWSDGDWMMTTHRWLGTSAGVAGLVVLGLSEASRRPGGQALRPWYLAVLVLAAVAVGLNGHYGGLMAYGENYYAWPGSASGSGSG